MSIVVNGDTSTYPLNQNMFIPEWLDYLTICFSIFNLSLAYITIIFQFRHPKSQRNMGRFFLLILILQTCDKTNIFIQELFFRDLSHVYYELQNHIMPRMTETKLCIFFGFVKTFVDFLSQFYCLWLAVLIKQILKDPIHRLNRFIIFYHVVTVLVCMLLCLYVQLANSFGVEQTLQCGVMHTPGLDDEYILLVPFLLVPFDIYLIVKIMRQTPFIVRQSLKRFVMKYIFTMLFLITNQGLQVALVITGSRKPKYFSLISQLIMPAFYVWRLAHSVKEHFSFMLKPLELNKTKNKGKQEGNEEENQLVTCYWKVEVKKGSIKFTWQRCFYLQILMILLMFFNIAGISFIF